VFQRKVLDEEALEELETALLTADVGVGATEHLLADLKARYPHGRHRRGPEVAAAQSAACAYRAVGAAVRRRQARPFVIMIAGVNGAGKTTSIGKLAKWLQGYEYSVLLAAGDTFARRPRAARDLGERNNVAVIAQDGGDPAAVAFDAVAAAKARGPRSSSPTPPDGCPRSST